MNRRWVRDSPSQEITYNPVLLFLILLLGACHQKEKQSSPTGDPVGKIIYDTYIINRDSTDSWGDECLSSFNRAELVDKVFDAVLSGKVTPYDYFTGEKIAPREIKEMEKRGDFSRDRISKIQFEERWLWDKQQSEMRKEIISMTIAYEVYDNFGKSRGQKPIFKLIFHQ